MSVNVDLSEHIKARIESEGPMSVADFMEFSLNKLDSSYYVSKYPIGKEGDFTTAPEISQLFGEIIGAWCAHVWELYNKPINFNLIELGPGKGTLMSDLLRVIKSLKNFHNSANICLVEINHKLRAEQATIIHHPRIKWYDKFDDIEPNFSIIVANEFFDALPINQYIKKKDRWHINMVDLNEDKKHLCISYQHVNHDMQEYLSKEYSYIPDQGILEVSDTSSLLIRSITNSIKNHGGAALIIDYGYITRETRDFISTLQSVKDHKFHPIFQNIGNADISAHVNFLALADIAKLHGGVIHGPITQRDFLSNMYIDLRKDALLSKAKSKSAIDNINSGYIRLTDPAQMGHLFKALAITNKHFTGIGF